MIQVQGLSKAFGETQALTGITMQVRDGSILGLIGSNGAGKSTLLRLMAGLFQQDEGTLLIDGKAPYENDAIKGQCVFLPDIPRFFPHASLTEMARYYRGLYPRWSETHYAQYLQAFAIHPKKSLGRMSKGMQRQASFLLGLAATPRYLFLDEAFDGLDPVICKTIRDLLIHFCAENGATVAIASHHLRELDDLCDCVCALHQGTLVLESDLDELKQNRCRVQAVFRRAEDFEGLRRQLKMSSVQTRGSTVEFTVAGESGAVRDAVGRLQPLVCEILPLTLEEILIDTMEGMGYESKILTD